MILGSALNMNPNPFMTFAILLAMLEEMEGNVTGSFLERPTWQSLVKNK
jgi:hypothetical protein